MSLINEVLNDLNKQKKESSPSFFYSPSLSPFSKKDFFSKFSPFNVLAIFLVVNLVVLCGVVFYKKLSSKQSNTYSIHSDIQKAPSKSNLMSSHQYLSKIPPIIISHFKLKVVEHPKVQPFSNDLSKTEKTFFVKHFKKLTLRQKSKKNYKKAMVLLKEGNKQASLQLLLKTIKIDPSYPLVRSVLAKLLLDLNKPQLALEVINKGLELFPGDYRFIEVKAELLLRQEKNIEALALLKQASPLVANAPDYYNLMAVAYEKLHQLSNAGSIYQQLIQINPENGAYWLGYGLSLEKNNNINQAISAYTHVMDAYDASPIIVSYARDRISALRG